MSGKILIIDDDGDAIYALSRALKGQGIQAEINGSTDTVKGMEMYAILKPDVVILDLSIDAKRGVESGFEVLGKIVGSDLGTRVIVLTGHGSDEYGVRALSCGAASFVKKPADIFHVAALVRDGLEQARLRRSYTALVDKLADEMGSLIVGESEAIKKVRDELKRAAQTNQPILILGETGTGKGLSALALHRYGKRHVAGCPR